MLWDKIKKAINSTIGTPNFKPLNEIVEDSFSTVTEKQNETRGNLLALQDQLISGENDFTVQYANTYKNMVLGSYVGTGKKGASNPNSLTFGFVPKLVVVQGDGGLASELFMVNGAGFARIPVGREGNMGAFVSFAFVATAWDGTTVSWYTLNADGAEEQFNAEDSTYRYIAFG